MSTSSGPGIGHRYPEGALCKVCREARPAARWRCRTCYMYWRTYGKDRDPYLLEGSRRKPRKPCANCKQALAKPTKSECVNCYEYRQRHGRRRPRDLFRQDCKTCRRPRVEGVRIVKGECVTCYGYRCKFGVQRPADAIRAFAPLGWCECGEAAVVVVEMGKPGSGPGCYEEKLCKRCDEWRMEMEREYGAA